MPNNSNPWLGLRTYTEGQILYGRSEEINALSQDILFNRQTVVYGKSGIGKSSLLNAGVFPILRRSNIFPVNVRLVHTDDKQIDYIEQIKKSVEESLKNLRRDIVGTDGKKQTLESLQGRKEELCPSIPNDKGETLWEFFHRHVFYDDIGNEIQPVIVFDQFEEIFTLCKDEKTRIDFFDQLADLINDIPPSYIYESNIKSKENVSEIDKEIDGTGDFILEEDVEDEQTHNNYLQEPKYHIVIILREEFLSYLERYTTNIPLLKHNRYCLRPLNDDQAGIIITDPVPGLISEEVAIEIICKVAKVKPTEFKLGDGITQLEVDSAMLSLFLSELFKKKAPEDNSISIELVRAIGDNIITSFYEKTIAGISETSAEFLEDRLITKDGKRNNDFEDVILDNGVSKEELDYLKSERLIHEFPWNGYMRIEFMHDTLCGIIKERKENREQIRIQEEEKKRQEEERLQLIKQQEQEKKELEDKLARLASEQKAAKKKRFIWYAAFLAAIILMAICLGLYLHDKANKEKVKRAEIQKMIGKINVNIKMNEEVAVKSLWWEACLTVKCWSGEKDTTLLDTLINKTQVDSIFTVPVDSFKYRSVGIYVNYKDLPRFKDISIEQPTEYFVKTPNNPIPVKLTDPITYGGRILMKDKLTGGEYNLKNALVVLNNEVRFTDTYGNFIFHLQDTIKPGDQMIIVKKGFEARHYDEIDSLKMFRLNSNKDLGKNVVLTLTDSINYYNVKAQCDSISAMIDSVNRRQREIGWTYYREQPIRYTGNKDTNVDDYICMYIKTISGSNKVDGFYYYKNDMTKRKKYRYHTFRGTIGRNELDSKDSLNYRSIELASHDIANNEEILKGRLCTSASNKCCEFKIFMYSRQIAESVNQRNDK